MSKRIYIVLTVLVVVTAGFMFWQSRPQTADNGAVQGVATQQEVFIDVRTDQEWQAGHLDNALHFDLAKMQQGELPNLPKDASIALYCRTGVRAGQALQILQANSFTNVRNAGGYADLQTKGAKICLGEAASCK
ncbi:MAG: rhodanese-like domain-containing protein [Patescibacteria group bacterium]|nr:rhodanese-like domain-containing protein [Patescibacteria group bacterium]